MALASSVVLLATWLGVAAAAIEAGTNAVSLRRRPDAVARFNETAALSYARLAGAAYCGERSLETWSCGEKCAPGASSVRVCRAAATKALVARWEGGCVIGIQGLDGQEALDLLERSPEQRWDATDGHVHGDLLELWTGLGGCVRRKLAQIGCSAFSGLNVSLAGHSFGGAIASLAMADLANGGWNVQELYAFGMPRAGDRDFAKALDTRFPGRIWRVTHRLDPFPAYEAVGHHVGREVLYSAAVDGGYRTCPAEDSASCTGPYSAQSASLAHLRDHFQYMGVDQSPVGCLEVQEALPAPARSLGADLPGPRLPSLTVDNEPSNKSTINLLQGVSLAAIGIMYLLIYLFHRRHIAQQKFEEERSNVMAESERYSVRLVTSLIPSLQVGNYRFRGLRHIQHQVSLEFEELGFKKGNRRLLQGVTGQFQAGTISAVMGPSGAGKTTFMNVLCSKAKYGTPSGTIRINGEKCDLTAIKSLVGFVPQDDVVHEMLTVREQIYYSARLRNPPGTCMKRIDRIVEDVLRVMQLVHVQHSIVGGLEQRGISGGQRKRVNIGLELAALPTVLFLDEPTSGLDATSALGIVHSLKKMTELGMTIVMVIHQPRYSLFTLCDDVLLLGAGGRTAYLGPSEGAKAYFQEVGFVMPENENPADWLMDVLSGEVKNTRLADFRLETLFEHWLNVGEEWQENGARRNQLRQRGGARSWTMEDDDVVIRQALHEEWRKFNFNELGVDELAQVFQMCAGTMPSKGVVDELFLRMGGVPGGRITERQFQDFLLGLRGSVASDAAVNTDIPVAERSGRNWTLPALSSRSGLGASSRDITELDDTLQSTRAKKGLQSKDNPNNGSMTSSSSSMGSDSETEGEGSWPWRRHSKHPGFCTQYVILLHRCLISWLRQNRQRAIAVCLIVFSAVVFGRISHGKVSINSPALCPTLTGTHLALAVPLGISCLQTFGADRPVFWRENSRGVSVFAFWLSRVTVAVFDVFVLAIVFASTWYLVVDPAAHFRTFWTPFVLLSFTAMSWGFLISTIVPPHSSTLALAVALLAMCGGLSDSVSLANHPTRSVVDSAKVSVFSWSVGMTLLDMVHENDGQMPFFQKNFASAYELVLENPLGYHCGPIMVIGVMCLVVMFLSYIGLVFSGRSHQV